MKAAIFYEQIIRRINGLISRKIRLFFEKKYYKVCWANLLHNTYGYLIWNAHANYDPVYIYASTHIFKLNEWLGIPNCDFEMETDIEEGRILKKDKISL